MNKLVNKLTVLAIVIISSALYSCNDDNDNSLQPYYISFTELNDMPSESEIVKVNANANEESLSFRLSLTGDPKIDNKDVSEYSAAQTKCYLAIEPVSVGIELGINDYTSSALSWPKADLTLISENSWTADGLRITKSIKEGYVDLDIHLNANSSEKVKYYKISFVGGKNTGEEWCIGELFIEQAAGPLTFKGRYKKQTYTS